ncbi:RidA family protein [Reyranella sp.]|uniref:RidA family protein n=1 Tax=Reyranella sp. TaxID=1929291 RepID=UPI003D0AAF12
MTTSDIAYTPILPECWTRPRGFSHAVVATGTRSVRIAGQIGREPSQAHIPAGTDAGTQWKVALSNVVAVLKAAGGQPTHLVALRAYVTDIAEFNAAGAAIGAAWGATLGRHFPAMTLVQVSALIDPNAKVEIEAEAILP